MSLVHYFDSLSQCLIQKKLKYVNYRIIKWQNIKCLKNLILAAILDAILGF